MAVLGNDFALILMVTAPGDVTVDEVQGKVSDKFPDFLVQVRKTVGTLPKFSGPTTILELVMEGPDQAGLVLNLSRILKDYNVSIRDLHTDTHSAPFAGYPLFSTRAIIAVDNGTKIEELEEELRQFEEDYGVELQVAPPGEEAEESEGEQGGESEGEYSGSGEDNYVPEQEAARRPRRMV